jgi:ABC-2 type transport system permease protein
MALGIPMMLLVLMSQSISLTVDDLPIVVQDFDNSTASQRLLDSFRASITFRVIEWPVDEQPEAAFKANTARAALIIPKNFSRDITRGHGSPVQMLVDGSDSNTAQLVSAYAKEVVDAYNKNTAATAQQGPIHAAVRLWYNPGRSSNKYLWTRHLRIDALPISASTRLIGNGKGRRGQNHSASVRVQHLGA